MVDHTPQNQEVVGSNSVVPWAFFLPTQFLSGISLFQEVQNYWCSIKKKPSFSAHDRPRSMRMEFANKLSKANKFKQIKHFPYFFRQFFYICLPYWLLQLLRFHVIWPEVIWPIVNWPTYLCHPNQTLPIMSFWGSLGQITLGKLPIGQITAGNFDAGQIRSQPNDCQLYYCRPNDCRPNDVKPLFEHLSNIFCF